jgi:hypothetical protein
MVTRFPRHHEEVATTLRPHHPLPCITTGAGTTSDSQPGSTERGSPLRTPSAYSCVRMLEQHPKSATLRQFGGGSQPFPEGSKFSSYRFVARRSDSSLAAANRRETLRRMHPLNGHCDDPSCSLPGTVPSLGPRWSSGSGRFRVPARAKALEKPQKLPNEAKFFVNLNQGAKVT